MNGKVYKTLTIMVVCALCLAIFSCSVFASNYDLSDLYTYNGTITLNTGDNPSNNVIVNVNINSNKLSVLDYDVEYTTSGAPTYTFTPSANSVTSTTTNSLGGSINLNSPTSTGSQTGRYTISNFSTTTSTYGFTASPSGSQTLTTHEAYIYQLEFMTYVSLSNPNNFVIRPNGETYNIYPNFNTIDSHFLGCSVDVLESHGLTFKGFNNADSMMFTFDNLHSYTSSIDNKIYGLIDNYETVSCLIKCNLFFFSTTALSNIKVNDIYVGGITTFYQPAISLHPNQTIQQYNTNNALTGLNSKVQSILDAYTSNQQGAQSLTSDTDSNNQKLDNIHQSEAQWYSQNSQAIESTGLSNFEFTESQTSALTGVFSLFQRLWTALGDYTFVITFTLMMSFATFFLRHNPVKKTNNNNYSYKEHNNNGSSS